jgi:hypothetical protein
VCGVCGMVYVSMSVSMGLLGLGLGLALPACSSEDMLVQIQASYSNFQQLDRQVRVLAFPLDIVAHDQYYG